MRWGGVLMGGIPGGPWGRRVALLFWGGSFGGRPPPPVRPPPPAACWEPDPHRRPPFGAIVRRLRALQPSALGPPDSFRGRQRKWRHEIRQRFERVRAREKVTT